MRPKDSIKTFRSFLLINILISQTADSFLYVYLRFGINRKNVNFLMANAHQKGATLLEWKTFQRK